MPEEGPGQELFNHISLNNEEFALEILLTNPPLEVINYRSYCELTPLHAAALRGLTSVCSLLIQHGALLNSVANRSDTPLHEASAFGHESTCLLLLRHDANLHIVNDREESPLTYTVKKRRKYTNNSSRKYYCRCGALMVLEWVRRQPAGSTLTGQQLIWACQTEIDLPIHHLSPENRKRMMEWVTILEYSKVNILSGTLQGCPLPFQRTVTRWLKTVSAEWDNYDGGARVRVNAAVSGLSVEAVERVVAAMATKYITTMEKEDTR